MGAIIGIILAFVLFVPIIIGLALLGGVLYAIPVYFIYKWILMGAFAFPFITFWQWVAIIACVHLIFPSVSNSKIVEKLEDIKNKL